ncbi:MAG: discoidin domain-containing protein [Nitrososphaerota archaeon]
MNKLVMTAIMSLMVILVACLGIGLMSQDSYALPKYEVKVTFDTITIKNDREGAASGDGEFDLSAFVQGKRVDLTGGSSNRIWDAQEGKTYQFNPGTEITVLLPEKVPISIFTIGHEVDGCGRVDWPKDDDPIMQSLVATLNQPGKPDYLLYASPFDHFKEIAIDKFKSKIDNQARSCSVPAYLAGGYNDVLEGWTLRERKTGNLYHDIIQPGTSSYRQGFNSVSHDYGPAPFLDYTLAYTISASPTISGQIPLGDIPKFEFGLESTCNNNLPVSSATSSGESTLAPANAIDNNPNTKWWSAITINPFITLDLGASKSVCGVDIAWADGNLHPYRFDVSVSTDGTTFTNVFSGTSTGTTTSPEKYNFQPAQARYVKITITESTAGSLRSIAQISEIDVFG